MFTVIGGSNCPVLFPILSLWRETNDVKDRIEFHLTLTIWFRANYNILIRIVKNYILIFLVQYSLVRYTRIVELVEFFFFFTKSVVHTTKKCREPRVKHVMILNEFINKTETNIMDHISIILFANILLSLCRASQSRKTFFRALPYVGHWISNIRTYFTREIDWRVYEYKRISADGRWFYSTVFP